MTNDPAKQVDGTSKFVPLVLPPFSADASNASEPDIARSPTQSHNPASLKAHSHSASLEVDRDGERITRMRIRCRCGEVIVVDCVD
jgi:hypothetical protein